MKASQDIDHFRSDFLAPLTFRIFEGSHYSLNDAIHCPITLNSRIPQGSIIALERSRKRVLHQRFYASRSVVRHRQLKPREGRRVSDAGIDRG